MALSTSPATKSAFSTSSDTKLANSNSDRPPSTSGSAIQSQSSHRRVVSVAPPWAAQDPDEEQYLRPSSAFSNGNGHAIVTSPSHERFASDVASVTSSDHPPHHHQNSWWTFAGRKPSVLLRQSDTHQLGAQWDGYPSQETGPGADAEKSRARRITKMRPQIMQKNRSNWLFGSRIGTGKGGRDEERDPEKANHDQTEAPEGGEENEDTTSESTDDDDDEESPSRQEEEAEGEANTEEADEQRDQFPTNAAGPSTPRSSRFRRPVRRGSSTILRLEMPLPPAPYTKAQAETPGWDSPWNPHRYLPMPDEAHTRENGGVAGRDSIGAPEGMGMPRQSSHMSNQSNKSGRGRKRGKWERRRKRLRKYLLHDIYVPLLFRIINLAFTSATLGVAVRIRHVERDNSVLGVVGPSATVTIVFGPITLVHVIFAIWLEYFGRPVGLWKTTSKLSYTLLEVALICAWAAALSLCFNDFLTTPLRCAPRSVNDWWNTLPSQPNPLANKMAEGQAGDDLCDSQLALICLAYVTLLSYVMNLIISLFRIIEKVKFHSNRRPWDSY